MNILKTNAEYAFLYFQNSVEGKDFLSLTLHIFIKHISSIIYIHIMNLEYYFSLK
jgi:hypothetical protein